MLKELCEQIKSLQHPLCPYMWKEEWEAVQERVCKGSRKIVGFVILLPVSRNEHIFC
jgi:hypothetical protein